MGKQEKNIKRIIEILNQKPCSKEEIIASIGFTESSWKKYTGHVNKRLRQEGKTLNLHDKKYSIVAIDDKESYPFVRENDDIFEDDIDILEIFHPSSYKTVKEVLVLNALSVASSKTSVERDEGVATAKQLSCIMFNQSIDDETENHTDAVRNILDNKQMNTEGLVQRGYVVYSSGKYSMTAKAPVYIKLDVDGFDNLKTTIQNSGQGYAFSDALDDIDVQMSLMIDDERYNKEKYSRSGFRGNNNHIIGLFLKKLNKTRYKDFMLKIQYRAATGVEEEESYVFEIGLVVYVADKDRLYFIGRKNRTNKIIIINTERIKKISETDIINKRYGSQEYLNIYDEMFSVSVEEAFSITVEFDNVFNIYDKLSRLKTVRPNAVIYIKKSNPNKIMYHEDRVRGIEDIARWLRSFGRSAMVLEPEVLRERMKESVILSLKEYGENTFDE